MIKIVNSAGHGEIWIYGDVVDNFDGEILKQCGIGDAFVWPENIKNQLAELKGKPLDVYIASDGGLVSAGWAIANMLQRHDAPVTAHIDSWAASIASVIALACDKVIMPANTYLMIHRPQVTARGNVDDLKDAIAFLENITDSIVKTYMEAAADGVTEDRIRDLMNQESWLQAEQCAELFKTVELAEKRLEAVAQVTNFATAPECLKVTRANDAQKINMAEIAKSLRESYEVLKNEKVD